MNSSGKLNGEPKWLTPPFSVVRSWRGSSPFSRAAQPEDARARRPGWSTRCWPASGIRATRRAWRPRLEQCLRDDVVVADQAAPVGVHAAIQRLVVEQLGGPFDGVDLRDLGGDHQARGLEQLVGRHVPVADHPAGSAGSRSPRVLIGRLRGLACGSHRRTGCAPARTRCGRSSSRWSSCPGTPVASWPAHSGFIGSVGSSDGR